MTTGSVRVAEYNTDPTMQLSHNAKPAQSNITTMVHHRPSMHHNNAQMHHNNATCGQNEQPSLFSFACG